MLSSAALLRATVVVDTVPRTSRACLVLQPYRPVHLRIGDRAEFIANGPPMLEPAGADVVTVTTSPGPTEEGPAGGPSVHVIVTLTATHPGTVIVHWTDCSGTGC